MKDNKKFLALCLAAVMAASTSTVVFAEGETQAPSDPTQNPKMETLTPETKAEVNLLTDPTTEEIDTQDRLVQAIEAAQAGETIDLGDRTIELTSTLTISKSITLKNGTINGSKITDADVINVVGAKDVNLTGLTVLGGANSKHNIQYYKSSGTLNNVTSTLGATSGYHVPLLVNQSTVTASGFTADMKGLNDSFMTAVEINAPAANSASFNGDVTVNGSTSTPVWLDTDGNDGTGNGSADVSGSVNGETIQKIEDSLTEGTCYEAPTASVGGKYYRSLQAAVNVAQQSNGTVELMKDAELEQSLSITDGVTIDGKGHTITAAPEFEGTNNLNKNLVNVINVADLVTFKNVTVKTTGKNRHALNVYGSSNVQLNNVTLNHSANIGNENAGAPLIINGSDVTVKGTLGLTLGEKSWYGINIDDKGTKASLAFAEDSKLSAVGITGTKPIIKVDGQKDHSTITSDSEFIDVTTDGAGNVVITPDPDGDSNGNTGNGGSSLPGTGAPITTGGRWVQSPAGWWYRNADGTWPANQWKYLDGGNGRSAWYWFNQNGYITFGWQYINGNWYYMNRSGEMQTGWQFINNKWYYLNQSGAMATGWVQDGGKWYYMNDDGSMHFGWLSWAGYWYHLDSHGVMSTGWKYINGEWYYLYPANGRMAANTTTPDGYRVDASGAWIR